MIRVFSLVTLCSALLAQDKVSPNRFVPKDSTIVMRLGAPAMWRQQFATTQLTKLMQAQTLAPLMDEIGKGIDEALDEIRQEGKLDADLVQGLLKDYAGEVVFAMQIDFTDFATAIQEGRPPQMSAVIALSPDGKFDLSALAAGVQKLAEDDGAPMTDLKVGDHALRVVTDGPVHASMPTMIDGHLVMLFASDLEKAAPKLLDTADRAEHGTGGTPMYMHMQLDGLVATILDIAKLQMEADGTELPFDLGQMVTDLGLSSLRTMEFQLGAADKHLDGRFTITTSGKDLGLMGMVMVPQGQPKLLRYIPPSAEYYGVTAFDIGAFYTTIAKVWNSLGEQVPMTLDAAEAAFAEEMKVRLKQDLLDHIGTELMTIGDLQAQLAAAANSEDADPADAMSGNLFGIALRNGKAFGESLEKALRARGLHASRKTEEYQGTKLHRLRLAGLVDLEYAVTDDVLLIALGSHESSHRDLRAVLDQRATGATEPAENVKKSLQGLADGWNGVTVTPIASLLNSIRQAFTMVEQAAELPEEIGMVVQMLEGVAGDLQRLGLAEMISTSHATGTTWSSRLRW